MESTTGVINAALAVKQKKAEELRKYNRDYYHAHKKGVGVRALQEDLLERQRFEETPRTKKNLKCKLLQATETIEKVQRESGFI